MSLEVVEMLIKESIRDGEISTDEKQSIITQADSFGVSKETVESMINIEIEKYSSNEAEQIEKKKEQERKKQEIFEQAKRKEQNERKTFRFRDWSENFEEWTVDVIFSWGWLYAGVGAFVGIINAFQHEKAWYMYLLMFLLGMIYGFIAYGVAIGVSYIIKRKPLIDWHLPVLIGYAAVVIAFCLYLSIPSI